MGARDIRHGLVDFERAQSCEVVRLCERANDGSSEYELLAESTLVGGTVEAALFIDKLVREFEKRVVGGRDLHRRGHGAERCHASGSRDRNRALAYESLCEACRCGHEERH